MSNPTNAEIESARQLILKCKNRDDVFVAVAALVQEKSNALARIVKLTGELDQINKAMVMQKELYKGAARHVRQLENEKFRCIDCVGTGRIIIDFDHDGSGEHLLEICKKCAGTGDTRNAKA